ncbi:MAG: hypothetical protein M0T85_14820 [Dehalococcoidales bacterium]|nr:hypothetical protein [Dehalococcoidales bacterium]
MSERIGEVIEASTTEFIAQSYELHQAPPFGGFVRASDGAVDIFGIVCFTQTCGVDPGRRPIARGKEEVDEEDIYRNNPELPELLRTEFTVAVVGFRDGADFCQYLPPRPPRIHGFVHACSGDEIRALTGDLDFLQRLVSANVRASVDELIAAALRQASATYSDERAFLVRAGKELAVLLVNDVNRLNGILRRIRR